MNVDQEKLCDCLSDYVTQFLQEVKGVGISSDEEAAVTIFRDNRTGEIGKTGIRIGKKETVAIPDVPFWATNIATIHTHTSGVLEFSPMDYLTAYNNKLKGHCVTRVDGNRYCEVFDPEKITPEEKQIAVNLAISLLSPNVKNREETYWEMGEMLGKMGVPCHTIPLGGPGIFKEKHG